MSPVPLVLLALVVLSGVGFVAYRVVRYRADERARRAMARRLAELYPEAPPAPETLPLRAPPGRVAIGPDGLLIGFGDAGALRQVPWSALRGVAGVGGGQVSVHVAHVGSVVVPGSLGRSLWEHTTGPQRGARPGAGDDGAERPRAARV